MNPKPDLDFETYNILLDNLGKLYMSSHMYKEIIDATTLNKLYGDLSDLNYNALEEKHRREEQRLHDEMLSLTEKLSMIIVDPEENAKSLNNLMDLANNPDDYKPNEKDLKKRIKHSKTPMERRMYEKQLNEFYKKKRNKKKVL